MIPFLIAPRALAELEDIWTYFAEVVGDPALADRINEDIFRAIRSLSRTPHMGHFRTDLAPKPARFWKVRRYLIVYRVRTDLLEVSRILDASRNIQALLEEEEQ
jgi:plasmid stabilization system protein ParE